MKTALLLLVLSFLIIFLVGCKTVPTRIDIDKRLLEDCPATLPHLEGTADEQILDHNRKVVAQYSKCARDKNSLNKIVRPLTTSSK